MSANQPQQAQPRARWSLRQRLVALVLALLATVATVIGVASTLALRSSLVDRLDAEVSAAADRSLSYFTRWPLPGGNRGVDIPGQAAGTVTLATDGSVGVAWHITDTGGRAALDDEQRDVLLDLPLDGAVHTARLGSLGEYRVTAVAGDGVVTVAGLSLTEVAATTQQHIATTAAVTLAGLLIVGLAGTWLVRRELRPLERVAGTAARVAATPMARGAVVLADRVPEADTDPGTEVGRVGAALNQLLSHVEDALAARHRSETQVRQFVADASHELRTPLASIRGYAELVRRLDRGPEDVPPDVVRAMDRVESEARRMTSLVEDLLLLARLDAGRPISRGPVDLASLAADLVADAHVAGPDHAWRLEVPETADDVVVTGDDGALRQVLANLLSNARLHTPAGTTVTTSVTSSGSGGSGSVTIAVRDDGPGIDPELVGRLFDRFARGDAARSPGTGTGLGLSIAKAVVDAHGGTIAADGTPGATTITVTLPVAGPAPRPPDEGDPTA
ncbi:sensor histidine kinase [Actinotalea fermentans]|uniref:histidine kinase n=1 Tax=Actinotalea fermentans TaxID=43671 RepID=A0A511YXY5_9CELL|nr:HAMP domain-containing sensor histidine kinase [Actinotalea fermentans]KGM15841.1 hypothetical protein N867_05095 [Actinotalea fermentans ATCC 43279 = JCM 9966 = DSM 3133]GEN80074.1 sensor histidine kinase [Actinotalea fermentans]